MIIKSNIIHCFCSMVVAIMCMSNVNLICSAIESYDTLSEMEFSEGGLPFQFNKEFEDVVFHNLNWERKYDFIAVTKPEGLPDDLNTEKYQITLMEEWQYYADSLESAPSPVGVYLTNLNELKEKYGSDCKIYYVRCENGTAMYRTVRSFALDNPTVLKTELLELNSFGRCQWDGTYTLGLNRELTQQVKDGVLTFDDVRAMFPDAYELMDSSLDWYAQKKAAYEQFEADFSEKEEILRSKGYSDREIRSEKMHDLSDAGLTTPSSWTMAAIDAATSIYVKYQDKLSEFSPNLDMYDWNVTYRTFSAWNGIGDLNSDGKIDARDATQILIESAKIGTNSSLLSDDIKECADVNADGAVNTKDATIILKYAAAQGSASTQIDLEEFII